MNGFVIVASCLALILAYWLSSESRTEPINLPSPPHLVLNNRLNVDQTTSKPILELVGNGQFLGPESIAFHPSEPIVITGCYDGSLNLVKNIDRPANEVEIRTLSYTGIVASKSDQQSNKQAVNKIMKHCALNRHDQWTCGRPLGMEYLNSTHLLVADAYHGLLLYSIDQSTYQVLWNDSHCDTNSVTVVKSQSKDWIYFTSASCLYRNNVVIRNAVSGTCTGSLRRVAVGGSANELLVDNLCFANGVIPLHDSVVVGITDRAQILSFNPATGKHAIVADNLPCLPDNLHVDPRNPSRYWFGCGGPLRHDGAFSLFDTLAQQTTLRSMMLALVPYPVLRMFAKHQAMIVHMEQVNSTHHRIVETLQDLEGSLKVVTSAAEHGEYLWMTSWLPEVQYLARIPAPK